MENTIFKRNKLRPFTSTELLTPNFSPAGKLNPTFLQQVRYLFFVQKNENLIFPLINPFNMGIEHYRTILVLCLLFPTQSITQFGLSSKWSITLRIFRPKVLLVILKKYTSLIPQPQLLLTMFLSYLLPTA